MPDPEVAFELDDWAVESRELVDRLLTSAGLAHAWQGGTLVVREADADSVEELIEEVEVTTLPRLDPDAAKVVYEVQGWTDAQRHDLAAELTTAEMAWEWDAAGDLVVLESDESAVDAVVDTIEVDDGDDGDEPDGLVAHHLMSELFLACDRLRRDARHAESVLAFVNAARTVPEVATPFGFEAKRWTEIGDQAQRLLSVFELDDADDDQILEQAGRLADQLRPYV